MFELVGLASSEQCALRVVRRFALLAAIAGPVSAQLGTAVADTQALQAGWSLCDWDGEPWAIGADYKARFGTAGLEFTPWLGGSAASSGLTLRLAAVEREQPAVALDDAAAAWSPAPRFARSAAAEVARRWDSGLEERFEVRADGVAWSVIVPRPVPGAGDLLLRYATTRLPAAVDADAGDALCLDAGAGARLHVSPAWAIDAHGTRTRVAVEYTTGALTLRMPAADLERAAFPLCIDPLLSASTSDLSAASSISTHPRIAWSPELDLGLAVWQVAVSAVDSDVLGRVVRVGAGGTSLELLGSGPFPIELSSALDTRPDVVWGSSAAAFLVVNERRFSLPQESNLQARTVEVASTNPLAVELGIAGLVTGIPGEDVVDGVDELAPTLGSPSSAAAGTSRVTLAFERAATGLRACVVEFKSSGDAPSRPVAPFTVTSDPGDRSPRFSAGTTNPALLTWQRAQGLASLHQVVAMLVQTSQQGTLVQLGAEHALQPGVAGVTIDATNPAGDGDGTEFCVSFESRAPGVGTDIASVRLQRVGASLVLAAGTVVLDAQSGTEELSPAVCWSGREYHLAWSGRTATGASAIFGRTLEPVDCTTCQPPTATGFGAVDGFEAERPDAAAVDSTGTLDASPAVFVWQRRSAAGTASSIHATLTRGDLSAIASLGGGCAVGGAAGGLATATHCAGSAGSPGNGLRVVHRLAGSTPGASAFMVIAVAAQPFPLCAGCLLHPDLGSALILPASAGAVAANGRTSFVAEVFPANPNAVAYLAQWVVVVPGATCLGLRTSDALTIDVELP